MSAAPRTKPPVFPDNIPASLQDLDQWVPWAYTDEGRKIPCSSTTVDAINAHDYANWMHFVDVVATSKRRGYAGIGFVFTEYDPYTGIDLDDCINPDGTIKPVAQAIIDTMNTYSEISPSGEGVKMWVKGQVPKSVTPTAIGDGVKVEIYSKGRFFTMTGQHLDGTPTEIRTVDAELAELYARVRPAAKEAPKPEMQSAIQAEPDASYARRYCLAALAGERQKVIEAQDGMKHNQRLASAIAIGGFIHTGAITDDEVFDALAVNITRDRASAEKTIRDGIAYGKEAPRQIPPQKEKAKTNSAAEPGEIERLREENAQLREANVFQQQVIQTLRRDIETMRDRNRFVAQTVAAEGIATPSKRLTFIELKKEIDRVPIEEREDNQFIRVRPVVMGRATQQDPSTISRHLGEFEAAGLIEKHLERSLDPETEKWTTELFVRPLVDLSDPTQVKLPSKPRGRQVCSQCGSDKITKQVLIVCRDCHHEELVGEPIDVNPKEDKPEDAAPAEMQSAIQNETGVSAAELHEKEQDSSPVLNTCKSAIQTRIPDPSDPVPLHTSRFAGSYLRHRAEQYGGVS